MPNVFKQNKSVNEHPNRNNFDLSKKVNASFKFGALYPVYCQPVVPGDSFDIDVAYNLKLMPIVFPVQTRMRAHMHFYYVRNKNLWTNWQNWISNLVGQAEHPHPYISLPDSEFKTGSIHDFLGVPTTLISDSPQYKKFDFQFNLIGLAKKVQPEFYMAASEKMSDYKNSDFVPSYDYVNGVPCLYPSTNENVPFVFLQTDTNFTFNVNFPFYKSVVPLSGGVLELALNFIDGDLAAEGRIRFVLSEDIYFGSDEIGNNFITKTLSAVQYSDFDAVRGKRLYPCFSVLSQSDTLQQGDTYTPSVQGFSLPIVGKDTYSYDELGLDLYSVNLRLNALPYRAYESICNVYYRNEVVNPFRINGEVVYNRYNTKLSDGADDTPYSLQYRNYELDFLTSALPSPQQGVAPLVGMTALGDITIEDENGITTAHAEIDNDGTISKVVLTSPAASVEHARTAMNLAACGMSINDFRATNALQRLLETNIRKGYKYLDFIAGHFGKEPNYNTLDIPEFIGGFSRDVNVATVVSNADTLGEDSGASLGQYGAYAGLVGGSNHSIRHYCDDYGYIIGILSVVPTPCYSQLLPKHMIAPDNFLDYYFPEMSQLGLQPITYREVAPIQSYIDSLSDPDKSLDDTFGYQRPNYDMVSAVDECHGEFRSTLKDYVINRQFDTRPELGADFIQVKPEEINDIFVDTNPDEDTILGEIAFKVFAKRPVPRVVIPNLGK